jgi:hypothetical protein
VLLLQKLTMRINNEYLESAKKDLVAAAGGGAPGQSAADVKPTGVGDILCLSGCHQHCRRGGDLMTAKKTDPPMKERKTYFSALTAENQRQAEEIKTLRGDNEALRTGMQDAAAAGNREALNRELAAANIKLVRQLREVLAGWQQERGAAFQERLRGTGQVRRLHEQLASAEQKAAKLEQVNLQSVGRSQLSRVRCQRGSDQSASPLYQPP